jgi:methyltransferase (TIGR00027 family)
MAETGSHNDSLGLTARWTASARAKESQRSERLFHDPWAASLAGPEGEAWLKQRPAESVIPIVIRARYFDDFLQNVSGREGIRQVVLMGAGLDTRAFRLDWPEKTLLFELDQQSVLSHKDRRPYGALQEKA